MSAKSGKTNGNSDFEGLYGPDDPELDASFKSFRQAQMELEEIMHDPYLDHSRNEVASMMVHYNEMKKKDSFKESETFIKTSLREARQDSIETKEIKNEVRKTNVNDLSAEWVKEWHRKKQMVGLTPADQERKNFITASLNPENQASENETALVVPLVSEQDTGKKEGKQRYIRFTALAAAVLGAFIAFRTLLPSGDPQKLYDNYYRTFQAVTTTSRGGNNTISGSYLSAINSYKKGDYNEAEAGFMRAVEENPSDLSSEFYLGLSNLETGDIDDAIRYLTTAAAGSGKFVKESQWYLGLAYLKKGEAQKASQCFNILASSDGFYREDSEKILRRLKK